MPMDCVSWFYNLVTKNLHWQLCFTTKSPFVIFLNFKPCYWSSHMWARTTDLISRQSQDLPKIMSGYYLYRGSDGRILWQRWAVTHASSLWTRYSNKWCSSTSTAACYATTRFFSAISSIGTTSLTSTVTTKRPSGTLFYTSCFNMYNYTVWTRPFPGS